MVNNSKKCSRYCFLVIGLLFGFVFFSVTDYYLNHTDTLFPRIANAAINSQKVLRDDVNDKLLNYIDGEWLSSIGDVNVMLKTALEDKKVFVKVTDSNTMKEYLIQDITYINGFLGIVNINICENSLKCSKDDIIPIQINKIFGMSNTLAISYDSRLIYCVDIADTCTRAFKRLHG